MRVNKAGLEGESYKSIHSRSRGTAQEVFSHLFLLLRVIALLVDHLHDSGHKLHLILGGHDGEQFGDQVRHLQVV